jgi:hypothetical protein
MVGTCRAAGASIVMGRRHFGHDDEDPANATSGMKDFAEEMVESVDDGAWPGRRRCAAGTCGEPSPALRLRALLSRRATEETGQNHSPVLQVETDCLRGVARLVPAHPAVKRGDVLGVAVDERRGSEMHARVAGGVHRDKYGPSRAAARRPRKTLILSVWSRRSCPRAPSIDHASVDSAWP